MAKEQTNIFADGEVAAFTPDAKGDYYKIGDKQRDVNYMQEKLADIMIQMSQDPTKNFFILYGGVVSDGGAGTIDISAGAAVGKDDDGNVRIFYLPAQTGLAFDGVDITAAFKDDRQIWIIGKYDFKYTAATRAHKEGTSYHYIIEDTFFGDSDGYASGDMTDMFVDADPNVSEVVVCWGSFQMSAGDVFTDASAGERTRILNAAKTEHVVISNQETFDASFYRNAANEYFLNDDIRSIKFSYLEGGYDFSSLFSGGDTWGEFHTNNCVSVGMEGGAYLDFGATISFVEIDTDDCYLRNIWVKGSGSVGAVIQSFLLNANRVTYDNCKVSNRNSNVDMVGFQGSVTALHNITSKYINCSVFTLDGSDKIYGFKDCMNISNGLVYDLDGSGDSKYGFRSCTNLASCYAYDIDSSGVSVAGFSNCYQMSACTAENISSSGTYSYGFINCYQASGCTAKNITCTGTNSARGFSNSDQISACRAITIDGDNGADGFYLVSNISGCYAYTIDSTSGNSRGFSNCSQISACKTDDIDAGGTSLGFANCIYGSSLYTAEASNTGNDWIDSSDVQITNKVSTPDVWG